MTDYPQARACLRAVYRRLQGLFGQLVVLDFKWQIGLLIDPAYDHARIAVDGQAAALYNALYEAYGNAARVEAWPYRSRAKWQVLPHQLGGDINNPAAYAHLPGMTGQPVLSIHGPYVGPVSGDTHQAAAAAQTRSTNGMLLKTVVHNTTPPPPVDPGLVLADLPAIYLWGNPRCAGPGFAGE